jgi:steroid delta-isomerase-like uncharacterized protein
MKMSGEENKALIRRGFEEVMIRGNFDAIDELFAPTFVNYSFPEAQGREGFKRVMMMFRTAFPDMNITIDDMIAEGDRVATRGSWTGTHRGDFMGIPATGKQVAVSYSDIWRLEAGKAVENWVQMDTLGLMQQLGVVPAPGASGHQG